MDTKRITLRVGEYYELTLPNYGSAGYDLNASVDDGDVLMAEQTGQTPGDPELMGDPEQLTFRITAKKSGEATVLFTAAQSWNKTSVPGPVFELKVLVEP